MSTIRLGDNLKKIATFGTKLFVRCSRHVHYLGCPLLRGFTVFIRAMQRLDVGEKQLFGNLQIQIIVQSYNASSVIINLTYQIHLKSNMWW